MQIEHEKAKRYNVDNLYKALNVKGIDELPEIEVAEGLTVSVSSLISWAVRNINPKREKPKGKLTCYDCGLPYVDFPDMCLPDPIWELINPSEHEGGGILCPTCIAKRLNAIGKWYDNGMFKITEKVEDDNG